MLVTIDTYEQAQERLESISLHDIGDMWPFYVLAVHRILEGAGYHDQLNHRLEMFDTMLLLRIDGDGFLGSIIPLRRAMLAMQSGRGNDAQEFLDREVEIIQYLAEGFTRAKMAEAMFISVNTLKTHLKSIYKKLEVSSAEEAVVGAQRRGLI